MEKYSKAVSEMYSQFKQREDHPMEMPSQSKQKEDHPMEMPSQSKQKEDHPAEKYIGRLVRCSRGEVLEVVGYTKYGDGSYSLIADATSFGGWCDLGVDDVVFKDCESYWYTNIGDLID